MSHLAAAFAALPVSPNPSENHLSFHTIPITAGRPHCLAKSGEGFACLLIVTRSPVGSPPAPIRLEHLTVQHGLAGTIHGANGPVMAQFSLISLGTRDDALVEVFLRFAEHLTNCLPDAADPRAVAIEIRRLGRNAAESSAAEFENHSRFVGRTFRYKSRCQTK